MHAHAPHSNSAVAKPAPAWTELVPTRRFEVLREVTLLLQRAGVDSLLAGAFAIAKHVGRWRGTKDIDLLIKPEDRDRAVEAMLAAGFIDYCDQCQYDPTWIFRAWREDELVDLIWTLPNHAAVVDQSWFDHSLPLELPGHVYRVVPLEELIWVKLFVMQRDRCDWPDVLNLLRCNLGAIDWNRLLDRLGPQEPLLAAVLFVLQWIAPQTAADLPPAVQRRLQFVAQAPVSAGGREVEPQRAALLDSRPWYAVCVDPGAPMGP